MKASSKNIIYGALLCAFYHINLNPCSIVGYIGEKLCKEYIKEGLSRLEYRGYDSAGFATIDPQTFDLTCIRAEGKLEKLKRKIDTAPINGYIGIGHTRWATHGPAIEANAHPHRDCTNEIAVVHNGIIENFAELKEELIKQNHAFSSETDTEVIPHLLEESLSHNKSFSEALLASANAMRGSYGFLAIHKQNPHIVGAVRKGSPICIGIGEHEMFIASDFLAFAGKTDQVLFMPNESCAIITKDNIDLFDFNGEKLPVNIQKVEINAAAYSKLGHEHFMLKEIYEQRFAIQAAVAYYRSLGDTIWKQLGITADYARNLSHIDLFGCGTSWHAARIGQFFFESICKIPAAVHLASEMRYMPFFTQENSLYIGISQSGETADTLELIRLINCYHQPIISITNSESSTMVRETQGALFIKAGPEIGVASTKAFTTQLTALYWLAHRIALEKGLITKEQLHQAEDDLLACAQVLEDTIEKYKLDIIKTHAKKYAQAKRFMFLGRHICYPFAMEAALKLKEISYIFAQGYPAGELKHGSIALVDIETPVMLFSHLDPVIYQKLYANAQEVKTRKGYLIAVLFEGQYELAKLANQSFVLPRVAPMLEPIAMAGFMQFFTYQIAKELGCDIDQPRNLAKAVTVE